MDNVYNTLCRDMNIDRLRAQYAGLYEHVKSVCLKALKKEENFKDIFNMEKLCGSYADNLKIVKPNEYDLVLRFKLPEWDMVTILPDENLKGNVLLNLTRVIEKLEEGHKFRLQRFFKELVNSDNFLLVNKFQKWLESLMDRFLKNINYKIIHNNIEYKLKYKREGPAHTIFVIPVSNSDCLFSIDFVPGFVFKKEVAITLRPLTEELLWEAIPRPLKSPGEASDEHCSFRTSYTCFERAILKDKGKLKNALRMMKKFRDLRPKLYELKSYYIKTLFLWMVEEIDESFWKISNRDIMIKVFEVFELALRKKEIKFYWDSDLNLIGHLPDVTLMEMHSVVKKSKQILDFPFKHDRDVFELFMSTDEIDGLSPENQKLVADCFSLPIE